MIRVRGGVAKCLGRWRGNPELLISDPPPCKWMDLCLLVSKRSNSSTAFMRSGSNSRKVSHELIPFQRAIQKTTAPKYPRQQPQTITAANNCKQKNYKPTRAATLLVNSQLNSLQLTVRIVNRFLVLLQRNVSNQSHPACNSVFCRLTNSIRVLKH